MIKKEYYICNQALIDHFPESERSSGFSTGYKWDKSLWYIAVLDFDKVKLVYDNLSEEEQYDICCQEIVSVPSIREDADLCSIQGCVDEGIFLHIEMYTGLTKISNIAYIINEMCEEGGITPIEFGDIISKKTKI